MRARPLKVYDPVRAQLITVEYENDVEIGRFIGGLGVCDGMALLDDVKATIEALFLLARKQARQMNLVLCILRRCFSITILLELQRRNRKS